MSLEQYSKTFMEMDKYGLLSEEDKNFLIEKGIIKEPEKRSSLTCPNCGNPLSKDLIQKISDLVIEAMYKDKEKYAHQVFSKVSEKASEDHDCIMFR